MAVILIITSVITLILTIIYLIAHRKYDYWEKKKVPHLKPKPIFGNYGGYIRMKKLNGLETAELCQAFPKEPVVGAFYGTEPALIVKDPDLIKLITTKDFAYFNGREIQKYTSKENFGRSLFLTGGDRWKVIRQNMTPLFTTAKMKNMFHLIEKCSHEFEKMLDRDFKESRVQEAKALMARFTIGCISACGFGIDTNSMDANYKGDVFYKMGKTIFETSHIRGLALMCRSLWPYVFYGLGFTVIPKFVDDFFQKLITDLIKKRNYTPSSRNDFVDLIMNWVKKGTITGDGFKDPKTNNQQKVNLKVDDEFLVAQISIFFAAGFETSASTLAFTLFELAKHPEVQKRATDEVDEYLRKNNNKLGYNCVTDLPFLEACLHETLRVYPVLSVMTREVMEDYTMPSGLHLDKGLRIQLPLYYLHHNPEYFPEPEEYRPERFLPEEKHKIKPYTYMPFGEGPRICIGLRFAMMQTLAGLVTFLKKYRVELAEGMPRTVEFEPKILITLAKSGINLKLIEREGWQQRVLADQSQTEIEG